MFFKYNTQLGPPYQVIVDTNFINFSIRNKLDIYRAMMDCLLAKCALSCLLYQTPGLWGTRCLLTLPCLLLLTGIPCITDCVMAELEKLGSKYRIALKLAKDPRFRRLSCTHTGTYADECIVNRVQQHRCYIVATCDKDLKRKIRKVPGVPIMYINSRKYSIERMPEAFGAPPT